MARLMCNWVYKYDRMNHFQKLKMSCLPWQNCSHLWSYSCIILVSILSDLTIDPPLLNLTEETKIFYITDQTSIQLKVGTFKYLSLYRTGYILVTRTKVRGTGPPLLLIHRNAKGGPTPLPIGCRYKDNAWGKINKSQSQIKQIKAYIILYCNHLKSDYKIPVDRPNELYMSHLCAPTNQLYLISEIEIQNKDNLIRPKEKKKKGRMIRNLTLFKSKF